MLNTGRACGLVSASSSQTLCLLPGFSILRALLQWTALSLAPAPRHV